MNSDSHDLKRELDQLKNEVATYRANSLRRQIFTAVATAVAIAAAFALLKLVADAVRPGYFAHLIGGIARADFRPGEYFDAGVRTGGGSAKLSLEGPATVIVVADGKGRSEGKTRSNIQMSILVDDNLEASEMNWTPADNAIEHRANASCVSRLGKGPHTIVATTYGDDLGSLSTKLSYYVVYDAK